jgi:Immunity protein 7
MYEFHGWFEISESADESDLGTLDEGVEQLRQAVDMLQWPTAAATVRAFNGAYYLNVDGLVNRRRFEADELDALLDQISRRFPGSYGLLYDRSDDEGFPAGPNAFRVRAMARGRLAAHTDPFLSPCVPVIED